MATIKQLKIGSTNYDIKALNASNQNQASAVVRDIQYGTSAPSGGSAGQVYLQYDSTTTNNPYVYAEDTIGDSQNAADNYYSKNEINNLIKEVVISGNTATFADGLIIQWGGQTIANNSPVTITYPKPFPNLCFRAIAWGNHIGFANWATINTDSITTTNFRIGQRNGSSASMSIQWLAIGY